MSNKVKPDRTVKVSSKGRVPKMRFPEFLDAGEWAVMPLWQICDVLNNRRKPITSSDRVIGHYPYYGASGIVDYVNDFIFDERLLLIGEDGAKWGPYEKTAFIVEGKYWVNNHAHVLKAHGVNDTFLENYLSMLDLGPFVTGAAPPKLTLGKLKEVPVVVPLSTSEQQKIADCLSTLDMLIAAHAQKHDALKAHKKGFMQQLFPAEGETVPRSRFPEFCDAGEWVARNAGTLFANRVEEGEDGLPIYSVTMNDGMVKRSSLERRVDDIAASGGNKKVYKNDIAYNMMRMWQGAFGVASEECMVSPAYVVLAPKDDIYSDFFSYLLKLPRYLRLLTSHSQGLTLDRLRLYYKDFARIPLFCPPLSEQKKIADCLSSLDALIAAQSKKISTLKTQKKGLMQQLFPSADEVTA